MSRKKMGLRIGQAVILTASLAGLGMEAGVASGGNGGGTPVSARTLGREYWGTLSQISAGTVGDDIDVRLIRSRTDLDALLSQYNLAGTALANRLQGVDFSQNSVVLVNRGLEQTRVSFEHVTTVFDPSSSTLRVKYRKLTDVRPEDCLAAAVMHPATLGLIVERGFSGAMPTVEVREKGGVNVFSSCNANAPIGQFETSGGMTIWRSNPSIASNGSSALRLTEERTIGHTGVLPIMGNPFAESNLPRTSDSGSNLTVPGGNGVRTVGPLPGDNGQLISPVIGRDWLTWESETGNSSGGGNTVVPVLDHGWPGFPGNSRTNLREPSQVRNLPVRDSQGNAEVEALPAPGSIWDRNRMNAPQRGANQVVREVRQLPAPNRSGIETLQQRLNQQLPQIQVAPGRVNQPVQQIRQLPAPNRSAIETLQQRLNQQLPQIRITPGQVSQPLFLRRR